MRNSNVKNENNKSRWVAWGVLFLASTFFIGSLILFILGCTPAYSQNENLLLQFSQRFLLIMPVGFTLLGALIITYRPQNRIGWLSSIFGLSLILSVFFQEYGVCSYRGILDLPGASTFLWTRNILDLVIFVTLFLFIILFPTGRFLSPRWKSLALISIGLSTIFSLLFIFWPGPIFSNTPNPAPNLQNPFALPLTPSPFWNELVIQGKNISGLGFLLLAVMGLFVRWRRSLGDERQQIKWVALILITFGTPFFLIELIGSTFYPPIFDSLYITVTSIFLLSFPLAFGLALFKYRLYDIDIIIRRTLVYGIVTLAMAGIYFGSVVLLQRLFSSATNQQSPLAIVISTLLIAALFNPLRQRIQEFIDRRFYRRKYDAQQTLAHFAATAQDEVDIEHLTTELVQIINETMQPESVTVWIKPIENSPHNLQNSVSQRFS